jgi:excisionase family DNA binding protein
VDHRPDTAHEWLTPSQVANLLGVTPPAVMKRIHRGRLPATKNNGRYYVRADLLELIERARLATKTRNP